MVPALFSGEVSEGLAWEKVGAEVRAEVRAEVKAEVWAEVRAEVGEG